MADQSTPADAPRQKPKRLGAVGAALIATLTGGLAGAAMTSYVNSRLFEKTLFKEQGWKVVEAYADWMGTVAAVFDAGTVQAAMQGADRAAGRPPAAERNAKVGGVDPIVLLQRAQTAEHAARARVIMLDPSFDEAKWASAVHVPLSFDSDEDALQFASRARQTWKELVVLSKGVAQRNRDTLLGASRPVK